MSLPAARAIADAVLRGETTAAEVVEAALRRTDLLIGAEGVGAFLHVDATAARAAAAAVDARIRAGERPPLAGVPVALKDNLADAGQPLGCASLALRGRRAARSATAVARLQAAGAVVLGRTNMDELAMGSSTEHSGYHGTLNPWDPFRVPGGSSGGSAAAVAAGGVPLALGTDTGGSIRQPAAFCGVVGLRPTWGRVSRAGMVPLAPTLDAVGAVGRSVRDVALAVQLIAGDDPGDPAASPQPVPDLLAACDAPVEGRTLGLLLETQGRLVEAPVRAQVAAGTAALEAAGARLRPVSLPSLAHAARAYQVLVAAEAAATLRDLDLGEDARGLLGPEVRRRLLLGTWLAQEPDGRALLDRARAWRRRFRTELLDLLEQVDALVLPTTPTVAFHFDEHPDDPVEMYRADALTTPASLGGLPALTVPAGLADLGLGSKMPAGLQLVGRPFDEPLLVALGAVVEAARGPLPEPPRPRW